MDLKDKMHIFAVSFRNNMIINPLHCNLYQIRLCALHRRVYSHALSLGADVRQWRLETGEISSPAEKGLCVALSLGFRFHLIQELSEFLKGREVFIIKF